MAYTRAKKIYSQEKMQFLDCEVLFLNEEDGLPNTLQREILLFVKMKNQTMIPLLNIMRQMAIQNLNFMSNMKKNITKNKSYFQSNYDFKMLQYVIIFKEIIRKKEKK